MLLFKKTETFVSFLARRKRKNKSKSKDETINGVRKIFREVLVNKGTSKRRMRNDNKNRRGMRREKKKRGRSTLGKGERGKQKTERV